MTDAKIEAVCRNFSIEGEYRSYEQVTSGHINKTYKVYFYRDGEVKDYILQRVNTYVFKNPVEVMNNIISVLAVQSVYRRFDDVSHRFSVRHGRIGQGIRRISEISCRLSRKKSVHRDSAFP